MTVLPIPVSLLLLFHLSIADQLKLVDETSRYFKVGLSVPGASAIADVISRTFFLGYIDSAADLSFLKLPTKPVAKENLLITITGLEGVDVSSLPSLQGGVNLAQSPAMGGLFQLVDLIQQTHGSNAQVVSVSGSPDIAKYLFGNENVKVDLAGVAKSKMKHHVNLNGLNGSQLPEVVQFVEEMNLLWDFADVNFGNERTNNGFYFATVVKFSKLPDSVRTDAAKVLDATIGHVLNKFSEGSKTSKTLRVAELILISDKEATERLEAMARLQKEAAAVRRRLAADHAIPLTYAQLYANQIRYWVSLAIGLTAYTFIYYMAFYGNYSADQLLYTAFNAKWDERKVK